MKFSKNKNGRTYEGSGRSCFQDLVCRDNWKGLYFCIIKATIGHGEQDRTLSNRRITARINRLAAGAFGDCKPVGSSVWELRVSHGPGYRVYYAQAGKNLILLLLGGDKRQQAADIKKAIQCWEDYQRRKP